MNPILKRRVNSRSSTRCTGMRCSARCESCHSVSRFLFSLFFHGRRARAAVKSSWRGQPLECGCTSAAQSQATCRSPHTPDIPPAPPYPIATSELRRGSLRKGAYSNALAPAPRCLLQIHPPSRGVMHHQPPTTADPDFARWSPPHSSASFVTPLAGRRREYFLADRISRMASRVRPTGRAPPLSHLAQVDGSTHNASLAAEH